MAKKKKLPTDTNKRAKSVVDLATNDTPITHEEAKSIASQLGRLGGLKGGVARSKALTDEEKIKIAKMGAAARWGHTKSTSKKKKQTKKKKGNSE